MAANPPNPLRATEKSPVRNSVKAATVVPHTRCAWRNHLYRNGIYRLAARSSVV